MMGKNCLRCFNRHRSVPAEAGIYCWACILAVCCSRKASCVHDDNPARPVKR